jgi:YD repeat-containing protein
LSGRSRALRRGASVLAVALSFCALSANAETVTYTYDALGRLISAATTGGHTTTYTYDINGNRTQVVVTGGTNAAPTAATDAKTTALNTASSFDPRTNDSDANGDALTITAKTNGTNGTVSITGGGTGVTYTPTTGFSGSDSFTYTISDGSLTAVGTVNMTVTSGVADGTVLYTKSTSGSFSFTIPAGVTEVDLEGWGGGTNGRGVLLWEEWYSIGGAGGGYFKKRITVTQGQVISGSVSAAGGASSTTVSAYSLVANSPTSSVSGTGGTASGGDVNTQGTNGGVGNTWTGGGAGNGGGNAVNMGDNGTTPGGGGAGDTGTGKAGQIKITARTS